MTKQVMITLNLIQSHMPYRGMWEELVKAHGGVKADLDVSFPLSSVLDSNDLEDTLWCFRCVPEYKEVFVKFTLFLIKHAERYTNDKRVSQCKAVTRAYLRGEASIEQLNVATVEAYEAFDTASAASDKVHYDAEASYYAAAFSSIAVSYAGSYIAGSDDAIGYAARNIANATNNYIRAVNYAVNGATNPSGHAVTCTFGTPTEEDIAFITTHADESSKQVNYLRKLLDEGM